MNCDAAHDFILGATGVRSPHESFGSAEIFQLGRQVLHRIRRNAGIKSVWFVPFFVQERLRAEDGMMGQTAAPEHDGIRSGETVFADLDWLRRLAAGGEVDTVGEQLRAKSA